MTNSFYMSHRKQKYRIIYKGKEFVAAMLSEAGGKSEKQVDPTAQHMHTIRVRIVSENYKRHRVAKTVTPVGSAFNVLIEDLRVALLPCHKSPNYVMQQGEFEALESRGRQARFYSINDGIRLVLAHYNGVMQNYATLSVETYFDGNWLYLEDVAEHHHSLAATHMMPVAWRLFKSNADVREALKNVADYVNLMTTQRTLTPEAVRNIPVGHEVAVNDDGSQWTGIMMDKYASSVQVLRVTHNLDGTVSISTKTVSYKCIEQDMGMADLPVLNQP